MSKHMHVHVYRGAQARDTKGAEIEALYKRLRAMSKEEVIRQFNSRLDKAHLNSEPKSSIINAILNQRFSRKDLDAWAAGARDCSIDDAECSL